MKAGTVSVARFDGEYPGGWWIILSAFSNG